MNQHKYVIAVSGGVDSVVLFHMLMSRKSDRVSYIVAHFDHGIREDSADDTKFVENLAKKFKIPFVSGQENLGGECSEEQARDARYKFLRQVKDRYKADKIVTAHHQDDLLETMIINIIRGTSPRGLAPMQGMNDLLRPLMHKKKSDLIEYAKENNLTWREDSTNTDEKFLRNYLRLNVMPKLEPKRDLLLEINKKVDKLYLDIDLRIENLLYDQRVLYRPKFVFLPYKVQLELTRGWLIKMGIKDLDRKTIERVTNSIKTLSIGKKIDIDNLHWMISEKQNLLITSK